LRQWHESLGFFYDIKGSWESQKEKAKQKEKESKKRENNADKTNANKQEPRKPNEPVYKTDKEASEAAKNLGYKETGKTTSKGAKIFTNGKDFITRDRTGHAGGAWKKANNIKDLESKATRSGTYDANLNKIGD